MENQKTETTHHKDGLPLRDCIIGSLVIVGSWIALFLVAVLTCQ